MAGMREAIEQDRFERFEAEWMARYTGGESRGRK